MMHFIILSFLLASTFASRVNFTGHKVLGLFPSDEAELNVLRTLIENPLVDVWTPPVALYEKVNIRVPPEVANDLENELRSRGIDFYVVTNSLQEWINTELEENPPDEEWGLRQTTFQLDVYHTFEAISSYLDSAAQKYSKLASVKHYGTTFEGNPIRGIKISSPSRHNNSAIWIDAGIHAREWVAPSTATYFIEQLLTGYDTDPEIKRLVDTFDWYILPVANPDGYKYTWTTNRMWRKNRARSQWNPFCTGIDPNRNFDADFGGAGTSSNACSEIFRGETAFSEAESKAIRDGVAGIGKGKVKAYFTLHSYSQLWMTPYGYSQSAPRDYIDQMKALQAASAAIQKKHGVYYKHGTIANTIYPASGSSIDWAYDTAGVKYSFAIELRDTGREGFILSNNQIIPNAEENWDGVKAVADLIAAEEEAVNVRRFSVKTKA